jgi:hypothetical protein
VNTAADVVPSTVMGREMSQCHAFEAESPRNSELVPTAADTVVDEDSAGCMKTTSIAHAWLRPLR